MAKLSMNALSMNKIRRHIFSGDSNHHLARVRLNLIPDSLVRWPEVALMALVIGIMLTIFWQYWHTHQQVLLQQAELDHLMRTAHVVKPTYEIKSGEERLALDKALSSLNYPWAHVFQALEKCHTADVSLMELSPSADKMEMQVTAQTVDVDQMLDYLETLKAQPAISSVVLNSQQMLDGGEQPLNFTFMISWR